MKTKKLTIICFGLLSLASSSFGAVTISFNAPFLGGLSANFANAAGVVSNGLTWGVIVDGTGNGFGSAFDALVDGAALMSSSVATDDYYFSGGLTSDSTQGGALDESDFAGTGGGNGGIGTLAFNLTGSAGAGDIFRVVWLSGTSGGYLSDPSFVIPADGQIVTFDAPFVGVDPTRSAGLTYVGTGAQSTGPGFALPAVPEPSAALLGAIGALGLLRRRRN